MLLATCSKLFYLVTRHAASRVVVAGASKVGSHRGQLARDCVEHRDRQVDELAELRRETTCKCLIDQAHCVGWSLLVQVPIGNVGREVHAQEVARANVAAELNRLEIC